MEQQKILQALETLSKTAANKYITLAKAWTPAYETAKGVLSGATKVKDFGEGAKLIGGAARRAFRAAPLRSAAIVGGVGAGGALAGRKLVD